MSRTDFFLTAALLVATSCGETSDAGGAASGSTTSSTSTSGATAGGSTTSATTGGAGTTSVGAAGGEGAGGDGSGGSAPTSTSSGGAGGEGGQGGQPPVGPTPAECFEIHDEEECYAAGCNLFLFRPLGIALDGEVCTADDSVGYCFLQDPEGGGNAAHASYVRDFDAVGPRVFGLSMEYPLEGWLRCSEILAESIRECCCWALQHPVCDGVIPLPMD